MRILGSLDYAKILKQHFQPYLISFWTYPSGQKFAFLWDVAIIEYKILTDEDCSLTTVKVKYASAFAGSSADYW